MQNSDLQNALPEAAMEMLAKSVPKSGQTADPVRIRSSEELQAIVAAADTPEAQKEALELIAQTYLELASIARAEAERQIVSITQYRLQLSDLDTQAKTAPLAEQRKLARKVMLVRDVLDGSMHQVALATGKVTNYTARAEQALRQADKIQPRRHNPVERLGLSGVLRFN